MKLVKQYKGFKIKATTEREKKEGIYTNNFYIFTKDNEEEWETSSLEEAIEWIDCY